MIAIIFLCQIPYRINEPLLFRNDACNTLVVCAYSFVHWLGTVSIA